MAYVAAVEQVIQANGFSDLEKQLQGYLATEANKFVTQVLEIANRIRRHRFGTTLTVSDINEALISRKVQPLIGYNSSYNIYDYVSIGKNRGKEILAVDEPQINLSSFENCDLPEYPKQVYFEFHWLAINGVQPKTQENQTDFSNDFIPDNSSLTAPPQTELSDQSVSFLNSNYQLPQQLFNFFNKSLSEKTKSDDFKKILDEIANFPAVQPLVPLYMRYFRKILLESMPSDQIVARDTRIIFIINALLANRTLNLDQFIQNFTSVMLSLYLSPDLAYDISQYRCLENIISRYNDKEFKFKIAESLANSIFSPSPSLKSKYGALLGIQELGLEVFKLYLLPNLDNILNDLKTQLSDSSKKYETRLQLTKLYNLFFQMCVKSFNSEPQPLSQSEEKLYNSVSQYFGYDSFYVFGCKRKK